MLLLLEFFALLPEEIVFGQNSADNLAVLHNQNHMVHEFGLSDVAVLPVPE